MKTAESNHQNNADVDQRTSIDYGIDELNLAEFPLASIAERRLDGKKTVIFEEPLFDRLEGKYVSRRLTISGSDRFGNPFPSLSKPTLKIQPLTARTRRSVMVTTAIKAGKTRSSNSIDRSSFETISSGAFPRGKQPLQYGISRSALALGS